MKFFIFITFNFVLFERSQVAASAGFYHGKAGGVCNNESDLIRTKDECTKALSMLGYQFKKRYWEGIKRNIPSGCSIRTLNNRPHLNTKPGVGRGRLDQVPICRGNVNSAFTWTTLHEQTMCAGAYGWDRKTLITHFDFYKTTQECRDLAVDDSQCSDTIYHCSASDGNSVAYCGCVMHGKSCITTPNHLVSLPTDDYSCTVEIKQEIE